HQHEWNEREDAVGAQGAGKAAKSPPSANVGSGHCNVGGDLSHRSGSSRTLHSPHIGQPAYGVREDLMPATSTRTTRCRLICQCTPDHKPLVFAIGIRLRPAYSKFVEIDATLDTLAPNLDLVIPADLVGNLIP